METPEGRSKGCGLIVFETNDEADKAISMFHNTEFNGRKIEVREVCLVLFKY
jgi:RNA recognition motif-containing protein